MSRIPSSQRHGYGARHEEAGAASARDGVAGFDGGVELEYWRERFWERPYGRGRGFEEYGPAFAYAVRVYPAAPGRSFEEVEGALEDGWHWHREGSTLGWGEARLAVRDAWRQWPLQPQPRPDPPDCHPPRVLTIPLLFCCAA